MRLLTWVLVLLAIALLPAAAAYAEESVLTWPIDDEREEVVAKSITIGDSKQTMIDTEGRTVIVTGKGPWKSGESRIVIDTGKRERYVWEAPLVRARVLRW